MGKSFFVLKLFTNLTTAAVGEEVTKYEEQLR